MKRFGLTALLATTVVAQAAPLEITGAWFRSLPGKLPAAGYFTAQNNTTHDLAITGARAEGCGMLMLHQSSNKGGLTGMDMVDKVTVPVGGTVKFAPGGYHLMCSDAHLKIGTKAPVLLDVSDGTRVAVAFQVKNAAGK